VIRILFFLFTAFTSVIFVYSACFGADDPNGNGNDYAASKMMIIAAIMTIISGFFQSFILYAIGIVSFFSAFAFFGTVDVVCGYILMAIAIAIFLAILYRHCHLGQSDLSMPITNDRIGNRTTGIEVV
jgi:hypothetical protein